ncbi:MAG TPA: gliding motility-associated C-terminal domain-containing protein, partial [Adhaeribacter sp.]|nr:gliding motility-associated C-terminal domain-containing protein [Adhaeribacter sp.]
DWGSTAAAATITATPENVHGCLGTPATLPVNITQILATPQPVGPASVCLNQASQLRYVMTNPTTGSTFTWSIPGATINSNTRGDTVLVTFNTAGTHNIVVQESSTGSSATGPVNCFGNSAPFPVTILPSPDATLPIAGPVSVCENAGNVAYSLTGAPGTSTYSWTVTHNAVTTPLTGSGSSVQFNATTPGQYTITTTETNAAGCVGTPISKVVTITPRPTLSQIEGPAYICPENLNNQLYYVASTPGQTFNWTVTGGTLVNPGSTNDSIYIDFSSAGTKEITVTPVSGTGCPGTPISMTVILDPATLQLNVATTAVQNDKSIELNLQMPNNSANRKSVDVYRREAGTAGFAKVGTVANTATTFQDNTVQTADKVYEYYLESSNECGTVLKTGVHNTMLLKVTANEAASEVNLRWNSYKGWGQNNLQGYEIYAQADNGGFELIRQVNASDTIVTLGNISARGFNQCFRIKANSTDTRASWSNASCVSFENPLAFYNIITPNNDKLNDVFVVENIHLYPGNELKIFNRWGSEVYSKKNYDNTWDGKNTADGTYYYFMKLADGRTYKGWVEIVR